MKISRYELAGHRCVEVAPDNAAGRDLPLIITLHGLGDQGESYVDFAPAINEQDYRYVFPTATLSWGGYGFAWFPFMQSNVAPGAARARGLLIELINQLRERYQVPAARTVLGGFSQGGMMTFEAGLRYPEKLAGLFGLSTLLLADAPFDWMNPPDPATYYASDRGDLQSALVHAAGLRVPVMLAHGLQDNVVPVIAGRASRDRLQQAGIFVDYHEFSGGHEIPMEVLRKLKGFLARSL